MLPLLDRGASGTRLSFCLRCPSLLEPACTPGLETNKSKMSSRSVPCEAVLRTAEPAVRGCCQRSPARDLLVFVTAGSAVQALNAKHRRVQHFSECTDQSQVLAILDMPCRLCNFVWSKGLSHITWIACCLCCSLACCSFACCNHTAAPTYRRWQHLLCCLSNVSATPCPLRRRLPATDQDA